MLETLVAWIKYRNKKYAEYSKLKIECTDLENKIKKLNNDKPKLAFKLKGLKEKDEKIIYLENIKESSSILKKLFERMMIRLFKRFDGYMLYFNKAKNLEIHKVKNLSILWKKGKKEMYNVHNRIGFYKNKPAFLSVYPYAMTLEPNGDELFYDAESYYNYVNIATKANLTKMGKSDFNLLEMIRANLILIILIIFIFFIIFTPAGKEFIAGIIG